MTISPWDDRVIVRMPVPAFDVPASAHVIVAQPTQTEALGLASVIERLGFSVSVWADTADSPGDLAREGCILLTGEESINDVLGELGKRGCPTRSLPVVLIEETFGRALISPPAWVTLSVIARQSLDSHLAPILTSAAHGISAHCPRAQASRRVALQNTRLSPLDLKLLAIMARNPDAKIAYVTQLAGVCARSVYGRMRVMRTTLNVRRNIDLVDAARKHGYAL